MKKLWFSIFLGFIIFLLKAQPSYAQTCPSDCHTNLSMCNNTAVCYNNCGDCPNSDLAGQFDCSYLPILGCNEYISDTTCKQGFKSTEDWCNRFGSSTCTRALTLKSCVPIPPPGTCHCTAESPDFLCEPDDNSCALNYTATCSTFLGCTGNCECVAPPPTIPPPPSCHYTCVWDTGTGGEECRLGDRSSCTQDTVINCGQFTSYGPCVTPHLCPCGEPEPTSSAPSYCADRCKPGATPPNPYPNFQYAQCFTVNMPDLPTPGVWDCWNTGGDCVPDAAGDCYCCLHAVLSPPAPITDRPALVPLTTCPDNKQGVQTAIGCIPLGNQNDFLEFILRWALGIAGGIAFVLIVYAGFLYMTSGGDKQKVTAAKELLTAAISGLLLLIFSVFVLDLLGVRILQIPGLK